MFKVIFFSFLVLVFLPHSGRAEEEHYSPEMQQAVEKINSLSGLERCTETWNILWPLAKDGDAGARTALAINVMPMIHMDMVIPPGRTGDHVSRMRDVFILFIHGMGDWSNMPDADKDLKMFEWIFASVDTREFNQCVSEKRYAECAAIAVDQRRIPSFDDYAAELDALMAQGFKPSCKEDGYRESVVKMKESIKE